MREVTMFEVVWFKRDLRISDHRPLAEAARRGPVLPLYIAEPDYWALPEVSGRQWDFTAECLEELRRDLAGLGQPLVIRSGDAVSLLARLHQRHGISALWSHEETGNLWTFARDKAVARFCREADIPWTEVPQFGVLRGLKDRDRWAAAFERRMAEPLTPAPFSLPAIAGVEPGTIPASTELGLRDDDCPGRQRGGRSEGLMLLDSFFSGRGRGYTFAMSSPLTAAERCSRLSPHLAAGVISMREVVQRAYRERMSLKDIPWQERPVELRSIDSLIARLHWHCHFIQKLESEPELETRSVHPGFEARRTATAPDDAILVAWAEGRTGFPFVDACMRSLIATGWINFRMRAMLVAFASYHLALDWRPVGERLARLFTDYEPGIHWPQVQMQAGQTGINTPRIYNPVKQSVDQDPDGVFMRRWLPELRALPTPFLHEPWRMTAADEALHGVRLGEDYPTRIVDHEVAARAARERLTSARRETGFGQAARQVYLRHGSRKRTSADDNPAKTRAIAARKAAAAARQMSLDV
jgi:deoxyribodipyrimidine photo-lyase